MSYQKVSDKYAGLSLDFLEPADKDFIASVWDEELYILTPPTLERLKEIFGD